jgi:hypothetical protein
VSLRTLRRSMIAATSVLAIGGSLALAGSAAAVPIPWGATTDQGSTTVYGLYNQASTGLITAQNLIVLGNELAADGAGTAIDSSFGATPASAFTAASSLTATNVVQIGADFAATGNANQFALDLCVAEVYPQQTGDQSAQDALSACTNPGNPYLAPSATAFGTLKPQVASAVASWPQLSGLLTQLEPYGGTLFSIDGNVTLSSAATVTAKNAATAYSITASASGAAANGGYVLPAGFTMTFPNTFGVNTSLASAELPVADEANPPAASAIGTVTATTPVATQFGGSNGKISGSVFVIMNPNGNITQPSLELSFGSGVYLLGTFPSTLAFPLTLTFGEATVGTAKDPIPFSSLSINFPAKTSPVKALSCTSLGQVNGTATDDVAGLAAQFGDNSDGYATAANTPVSIASTPTVVTDLCAPTTGTTTIAGIKKDAPTVGITLKAGSAFSNAVITLPSGFSAKGLKTKDLKVTGAKIKSLKASGAKVTITFKSATKNATIKFVKGLSVTKKLETAVTKKKTKSLAIKFTVKYATVTSTAASVTVKKLS